MKKSSLALVLALVALAMPCAYAADDLCSVGPTHCKILKEDAKVRVIDYTAKAGDKVGMHTHPAHVIYVLKGGRTKFTLPDGSTTERDLKPGDAVDQSGRHARHGKRDRSPRDHRGDEAIAVCRADGAQGLRSAPVGFIKAGNGNGAVAIRRRSRFK